MYGKFIEEPKFDMILKIIMKNQGEIRAQCGWRSKCMQDWHLWTGQKVCFA